MTLEKAIKEVKLRSVGGVYRNLQLWGDVMEWQPIETAAKEAGDE